MENCKSSIHLGQFNKNGFEFTNRFSSSQKDLQTLFEAAAETLGIRHKRIGPFTPRRNGKVERSHREDRKRFYASHAFFSLDGYVKQFAAHNRRSNNFSLHPLALLSPNDFFVQFVCQAHKNLRRNIAEALAPLRKIWYNVG